MRGCGYARLEVDSGVVNACRYFVAVLTVCGSAMYPGPSRATEHGGCAEGSQLELVSDDEHNGEPCVTLDSPSYSEKASSDESSCCVDSSAGASARIVGPKVSLLDKGQSLHDVALNNPEKWDECDESTPLYVQVTLDDVTKGTLRYKCSYDAKYEDVVMVMRANKVIEHVHPDVLSGEMGRLIDCMVEEGLSPRDVLDISAVTSGCTEPSQPSQGVDLRELSPQLYAESSGDDDKYCRPKRIKELTKEEVIIEGLSTGQDAPLEVQQGGIVGRGVFATEHIPKGSWLCEYKTTRVFKRSELEHVKKEYELNNEGSYIVESAYPVGKEGHLCFDATRKYHQFGRYFNHARCPNSAITPPFNIRGKWRVGFLAVRDIDAGDEVVWDYKVDDVEWSGCTLKGGVINPSKKMSEKDEKEKGSESDSLHCEVVMHHSGRRPKRRLCYCPIEGCTSRPLAKLSNHLAQVHHLNPQERAKYLGVKRKFASQRDVEDRVPRTTLRRSQRKLTAFLGKYGDSPVEVSESDSDEAGRSEMDSEPPREASTEEDSSLPTDESVGASIIGRLKISDRDMETDDHDLPESSISSGKDSAQDSSAVGGDDADSDFVFSNRQQVVLSSERSQLGGTGRTETAPRFAMDEPFLSHFADYLTSRVGGRKSEKQIKEICTDVSKYLWFANSSKCDPENLLSRKSINDFVVSVEKAGVGPSGILTKLRRLSMAIQCLQLSTGNMAKEIEVNERAAVVKSLLSTICASLTKEKSAKQTQKLLKFSRNVPDVSEVNKFISSPEVDAFYQQTVDDGRKGIVSVALLYKAMVIIAGRLMMRNGQRPGAVSGMLMDELEEGLHVSEPSQLIILVKEQKGKAPAKLVVSGQLVKQLKEWVNVLRPLHVPSGCEYVFASGEGEKFIHISREITKVADEFEIQLPTATSVRKAIATKGADLNNSDKTALAHSMGHSVATADTYYRAHDDARNVQGYEAVGSILELPTGKRRQRFSEAQTELIKEYFSVSIGSKTIPSSLALEKFLLEYREMFPGRVRADIYSKVRNIIGRN